MKRPSFSRRRRSGAALLLVLWALFLLSAMVIAWALDINSRLALTGNASRVLEAEAMASSGAEIALNPTVTAGSSALRGSLGKNQTFEARIVGEGGRLNLNWLLSGEDPNKIAVLRRYLENKGVDINERDKMIDSVLDFVDPDDLPRLNGVETEQGYRPKNALFQRIEELKEVKGWEKFTARPNWDEDFTIDSSPGKIDLVWASRDVLLALPGFNEQIVDRYLELRRGPDKLDGTEDDMVFESQDQVRLALGFSIEQFDQLSSLKGFNDQVVRVVSVGKSGTATRTIQMIIRKGASPQMIRWKEL